MKLIVGLGNPGEKYTNTRHNLGFMVVDKLREELEANDWKLEKKFKALISEGSLKDEKVLLAQPQTFMNLSGEAVWPIVNFYKIEIEDILVVVDDLALPLGKIRFRKQGSSGGHNGLQSIINSLGSSEFHRLRIGIGETEKEAATQKVLGQFSQTEQKIVQKTVKIAVKAVKKYLAEGIEKAMADFN